MPFPTDTTPLQAEAQARFFLLANRGKLFGDRTIEALFSDTGEIANFTAAANLLFTELGEMGEAMRPEVSETAA